MKTKQSTLLQTVAFLTGMTLAGGCTTPPEVQAQQSQFSTQNQEQTTVVSDDTTSSTHAGQSSVSVSDQTNTNANSYANMASALEGLPDYAIGEDGLFQMVNTDYHYNDNWYKGYAGMFTPEDIAGKTIGGYAIELPLQIYGSWSSNSEEYFERVEDDHYGLTPVSSLYKNRLAWLRPEFHNYAEQTPYYEFDQEFRDMIVADDSLSTDEQLELIIKNHKGFIQNLNIGDLAMETLEQISPDELRTHLDDLYGVSSVNDVGRSGYETIFHYDNDIYITYDSELNEAHGVEFVEQIASSLEIIKHRLPVISDVLLPPGGVYLRIALVGDNRDDASAMSRRISDNKSHLDFYPSSTLWKLDTDDFVHEGMLSTVLHELIHTSIQQGYIHNFPYADEHFGETVETFVQEGALSELLTYSSVDFLGETINMSFSGGYTGIGINSWYGYVDNTDTWEGKDPMDYFVRIIDNRLGQ